MEQSLTNSSKLRSSRKPIFPKKDKENGGQSQSTFNRTASFLTIPSTQSHSPITHTNQPRINNFIQSGNTPNAANLPQRINYSQPNYRVVNVQPQPMFVQTQSRPFYQPSPRIQQNHPIPPFIQTQPLPRHQPATTFQEHPQDKLHQLQPTVIAVERVMRPVSENTPTLNRPKPNQQSHLLSPSSIQQPSQIRVFEPIHRKQPMSDTVNKLTEINNLLSENYQILYDEFSTLKNNIENNLHERQFVNQTTFLRRSINQIENIFNAQTNCTLAQMDEIYRRNKDRPNALHKSHAKVKYCFS